MLRKIVINGAPVIALSFLLSCVWTALLNCSSGRIVHSWEQPKEIDYKSFGPYTLFVREKAPDGLLFGGRAPRHEIFIGRNDTYGHWFDCTFHAGSFDEDEIDAYIRRSTVAWTEDGVSLKQESGHVIFFPKKTFIGGR